MRRAAYQHIYLSPHLDDVVFSCGGTILEQRARGENVLVVTVFTGIPDYDRLSPAAQFLHDLWGNPTDIVGERCLEDRRAMEALDVDYLHLGFLDAIYRFHELYFHEAGTSQRGYLYPNLQDLQGGINPLDHAICDKLASKVKDLLDENPGASLYAPLAVGRHVDHQLVRDSAPRDGDLGENRVFYYEDFPYVCAVRIKVLAKSWAGTLDAALTKWPDTEWDYTTFPFDIQAKVDVVKRYVSQVMGFGEDEFISRMVDYYSSMTKERECAERFWSPQPACPLAVSEERVLETSGVQSFA